MGLRCGARNVSVSESPVLGFDIVRFRTRIRMLPSMMVKHSEFVGAKNPTCVTGTQNIVSDFDLMKKTQCYRENQ